MSAIESTAVRGLLADVGVNFTLMVQLTGVPGDACRVTPSQLFVSVKSPVGAMLMDGVLIVTGPVPVLVTVTVCAALIVPTTWLPNVSDGVDTLTVWVSAVPVPVRLTDCGLPVASSAMESVPVRGLLADVGVNVTPTVQLFGVPGDGWSVTPSQVLVCP